MSRSWEILFMSLFMMLDLSAARASDTPSFSSAQSYTIAEQPLNRALLRFALQNHLQLSFDASLTQGKTGPELKGVFSMQEALAILLQSTGLDWSINEQRTLFLYRPSGNGDEGKAPSHPEAPR